LERRNIHEKLQNKKVIKQRQIRESNKRDFANFLLNKDWPLIDNSDCDKAALNLEVELDIAINNFFPSKERVINIQTNKPWYTQKLSNLKG
jgi:hypothetical protein